MVDQISMNKVQKILLGLLLGYLLLLGLVWITAPDPEILSFPDNCPKVTNCTRVADTNVRGDGLSPLEFNISSSKVISLILDWIDDQAGTSILYNTSSLIHAKFLSAVFRFPDDFMVKISSDVNSTVIWVQSQARLGESDLGVNEDRVQAFLGYMGDYSIF